MDRWHCNDSTWSSKLEVILVAVTVKKKLLLTNVRYNYFDLVHYVILCAQSHQMKSRVVNGHHNSHKTLRFLCAVYVWRIGETCTCMDGGGGM